MHLFPSTLTNTSNLYFDSPDTIIVYHFKEHLNAKYTFNSPQHNSLNRWIAGWWNSTAILKNGLNAIKMHHTKACYRGSSSHIGKFKHDCLNYALIISFPGGRPLQHPRGLVLKVLHKPANPRGCGATNLGKCPSPWPANSIPFHHLPL